MGTEIILLVLPFVVLHTSFVIYKSSAPSKRLRAFLLTALCVGTTYAVISSAEGSIETFLTFTSLLAFCAVAPGSQAVR